MSMKKIFLIFVLLSLCMGILPFLLSAQDFDYHREESPSISWNGVIFFDARMLAAGGISLMASPAFSAALNPALIPPGQAIAAGGSFAVMKHEAFQYWGINQGIYGDIDPQSDRNSQFSGFTLIFPVQRLRLSAGWHIGARLELPDFVYEDQYWAYSVRSTGSENNFFAAAAFQLGKNFSVGIKLDYVSGKRDVTIDESWREYPVRFLHEEHHRLSWVVPALGAAWKISSAWTLATAVIYPLQGKAKRTLDRIFESNVERVEILDQKSTDTLYRPICFYLTASFAPLAHPRDPGKKKMILAAEAVYTLWSSYRYEFFSETLPREMKNTLVLALGMEYGLFGTRSDYFARLGYRLDPQPLKGPGMILQALTGGLGIRWGNISLDIGALYYFGSQQGIKQKHAVLNSTMNIRLGGR
jgi:hypothetical protein